MGIGDLCRSPYIGEYDTRVGELPNGDWRRTSPWEYTNSSNKRRRTTQWGLATRNLQSSSAEDLPSENYPMGIGDSGSRRNICTISLGRRTTQWGLATL